MLLSLLKRKSQGELWRTVGAGIKGGKNFELSDAMDDVKEPLRMTLCST